MERSQVKTYTQVSEFEEFIFQENTVAIATITTKKNKKGFYRITSSSGCFPGMDASSEAENELAALGEHNFKMKTCRLLHSMPLFFGDKKAEHPAKCLFL